LYRYGIKITGSLWQRWLAHAVKFIGKDKFLNSSYINCLNCLFKLKIWKTLTNLVIIPGIIQEINQKDPTDFLKVSMILVWRRSF
jgi:hypothetical protein